jgi:hypothetical protein
MPQYKDGDQISDEELVVRRFKKTHLIPAASGPAEVHFEAFKPRVKLDQSGKAILDNNGDEILDEKTLSFDVKDLLTEPIGSDQWVKPETTRPLATCELKAIVTNSVGYPLMYGDTEAPTQEDKRVSHCEIHECEKLLRDVSARKKMAAGATVIHIPVWENYKKKK